MRRFGVLLVAVTLTGCGTDGTAQQPTSPTPELYDLSGALEAPECFDGYEITFASVTVRDQDNAVIGSGTTGDDIGDGYGCRVVFRVDDLPRAEFYQIEIGTHGGPSYSFAEMEEENWNLELSLD